MFNFIRNFFSRKYSNYKDVKLEEFTVEKVQKEENLLSLATNQAKYSEDSELVFEAKRKIESYVQNNSNLILDKYRKNLEEASNAKSKAVQFKDEVPSRVENLNNRSKEEINSKLPSKEEGRLYEKQANQSKRQLDDFRTNHGLEPPYPSTPHPDWRYLLLLIPFILLCLETYLNGAFLGERSLKVTTGYSIAIGVAFINVFVGYLVGSYLLPRTNLSSKHKTGNPLLGVITVSLLIFVFNGAFGHYREAWTEVNKNEAVYRHFTSKGYDTSQEYLLRKGELGQSIIKDGKELKYFPEIGKPMLESDINTIFLSRIVGDNPLQSKELRQTNFFKFLDLGDFKSYLLFLLGFIFYLGTMYDFLLYQGSYPGYRRLKDDYDAQEKKLDKIRQKEDKVISTATEKLNKNKDKLYAEMHNHKDSYTDNWDKIEYMLSSFLTESNSLNKSTQRAYEEFISRFNRLAPPELTKLSESEIGKIKKSINVNSSGNSLYLIAKEFFPFLKEIFDEKKEKFKDKSILIAEFDSLESLFGADSSDIDHDGGKGSPNLKALE